MGSRYLYLLWELSILEIYLLSLSLLRQCYSQMQQCSTKLRIPMPALIIFTMCTIILSLDKTLPYPTIQITIILSTTLAPFGYPMSPILRHSAVLTTIAHRSSNQTCTLLSLVPMLPLYSTHAPMVILLMMKFANYLTSARRGFTGITRHKHA